MSASTPNEPAVTPAEPIWSIWTALAFLLAWFSLQYLILGSTLLVAGLLLAPPGAWSDQAVLEAWLEEFSASALTSPYAPMGGIAVTFLAWVVVFGVLQMMFQRYPPGSFARALGMVSPGARRPYVVAVFVGVILLLVSLPITEVFGVPPETAYTEMLKTALGASMLAIHAVVFAPFFEELFFRGFIGPPLDRRLGAAMGAVVNGAIFSAVHAPAYGGLIPGYLLPLWLMGVAMAGLRFRYRSIWIPVAAHAAFNTTSLTLALAFGIGS